jgi:hypothetical protein
VHGLHRTYHRHRNHFGGLDRLLGDEAQVEARFCLFGDSATLGARLVHGLCQRTVRSEIVLEAPDGTPW